MKAKKSRVILSGVSLLLVLCLLVGGTMAWFTDTEKVDTNFTAGILDVSVKPGEEGKTALDFENLRPMLYENFYKELDKNEWNNDVTQGGTTGLKDSDYDPVPAYFKPVEITNEGTLPTKVKLSLEAGNGCADGEPILTDDNITITQDGSKQDCANRLAPVLKVFVYKLVGEDWTLVEGVNLNTAYDEDAANPDGVASENTAEEANSTYMTAMIPANGTAQYVIAGYLPETVGNAYQGQHYHGNLVLNAYQMDDTAAGNPDEGGSSSEDPDDPDRFNDNVTIEWRENTLDGTLVQSRKVTVKSDTTIAAADYDAPQGYVYSPAAADQSSAVTVDDETGAATPATVVFTVVREDVEDAVITVRYNNTLDTDDTADDVMLTTTQTVSLAAPGEYYIAAENALDQSGRSRAAGKTRIDVPAIPEAGYVFDPDTQSIDVTVDAEGNATPTEVTFNVRKSNAYVIIQYYDQDLVQQGQVDQALVGSYRDTVAATDGQQYTYATTTPVVANNLPSGYEFAEPDATTTITYPDDFDMENSTGDMSDTRVEYVMFQVKRTSEPTNPDFAGGDGSQEHPFLITNDDQLNAVRKYMDKPYYFEVGNNFSISTTKYEDWNPLGRDGSTVTEFIGNFNGAGYTISDFHANNEFVYPAGSGVGLFASIGTTGVVENLNFETPYSFGNDTVGVVAGLNKGLIQNCHLVDGGKVEGVGESTAQTIGNRVGGITGENQGTVRNCSSSVEAVGYINIGGLVGINFGTIEGCYSTGGVNTDYTSLAPSNELNVPVQYVGGLVGSNQRGATIVNCYNNTSEDVAGYNGVGGFIGYNAGTVQNCYSRSTGSVWSNRYMIAHRCIGAIDAAAGANPIATNVYYESNYTTANVNKGVNKTAAQLQSGTLTGIQDNSAWVCESGSYPKLAWEVA